MGIFELGDSGAGEVAYVPAPFHRAASLLFGGLPGELGLLSRKSTLFFPGVVPSGFLLCLALSYEAGMELWRLVFRTGGCGALSPSGESWWRLSIPLAFVSSHTSSAPKYCSCVTEAGVSAMCFFLDSFYY